MAIQDLHKIIKYVGQLNSITHDIEFIWRTNKTEVPDKVRIIYNELKLAIFNFRAAVIENDDDILPQQ